MDSSSGYQSVSIELKLDSTSEKFYLSLPAYLREIVEMQNNGKVTASQLAGIVIGTVGLSSEIDFNVVDNNNTTTKTVLEWLQEINSLFEDDSNSPISNKSMSQSKNQSQTVSNKSKVPKKNSQIISKKK